LLAPLVIAAPLAPQIGGRREANAGMAAHRGSAVAVILALALVSLVAAQVFTYRPNKNITPARAVAAIKASGKTHILNSYGFGGYLIAEGVEPFIDGRTELYGKDFVLRHDRALTLHSVPAFLQLLREHHIDITLLARGTPAIGMLDRLDGWKRIYADDIAVVHERIAAGDAAK
jgi:hypothetical protein